MYQLPLKKRILRHSLFQAAVCWLIAWLIRLVYVTSSVKRQIDVTARPYVEGHAHAIFAFWHGRLMLMPMLYPRRRAMAVLISQHRDGTLLSQVMKYFSVSVIRGSSSKGGSTAAKEMIRFARAGGNIGITPDGPRGPMQQAGKGVIQVAHMTSTPIVPVSISASRYKCLRSWDRFMIALPFSRIMLTVGEPIDVATNDPTALEQKRAELENTLNRLTCQADHYCGVA